jgi:hypothetical protein
LRGIVSQPVLRLWMHSIIIYAAVVLTAELYEQCSALRT